MTLSKRVLVPLPEKGVTVRRSGRYNTVFKVLRYFRDENGRPNNDRVVIGKLDHESGLLIPNDKYWDYYESKTINISPYYRSNRSIGASFLIGHILDSLGITKILNERLDEELVSQIRTVVLYMTTRGNILEGVMDFCEEFTLSEKPLDSRMASELFSSITYDDKMAFFRKWSAIHVPGSFLAYDVTSFSTYAKNIADSEFGYNRDGDKLPQINFGCYVSQSSGLPVFFVTYPGSIVDKSHLPYMMAYNKELGITDVGFVLDRVFCSTNNIKYMNKEHLNFILGIDLMCKSTKDAIDSIRSKIMTMRNRIDDKGTYGTTVHDLFYGVNLSMHIYYNPEMAELKRQELFRKIEAKEEILAQKKELTKKELRMYRNYFIIDLAVNGSFNYTRDYDKIDKMAENCGIFCLLTNTNLDSARVLSIYRQRDMIEKSFDDLKNYIDMKRMRTHNTATTEGKLFCAFLSLIVVSEIGVKLGEMMKKKSWSKARLITELEKIRVVESNEGIRQTNPLTKTQRLILETFGLKEVDLTDYIARH
ncbi:MAG: transposase [Deltaproteobacteria bacterium]|jgi:transposase|nr:transposase [Deltaproteobacteria bacterium]